jgi:uncharacterized protein YjbI with pentapeptide repeats
VANDEHLNILKQGSDVWNKWRENIESQNLGRDFIPDLSDADLRDANLRDANLSGTKLLGANLDNANLVAANLNSAILFDASLREAKLGASDFTRAVLVGSGKGQGYTKLRR